MTLYDEIAKHLNITTTELKHRLCKGEPIVHAYHLWKNNWDGKGENCPW